MSGFLDHAASAPRLSPMALLQGRPLVILAPHPDDETLGCGALLFDAAAQGTACHVICVTDGTRSHPGSRRWPAPVLAATREAELRAACAILAPAAKVTCLGYPDCAAPEDRQAAGRVSALIEPDALVLATWAHDPHIDHQQVAGLAMGIAAGRADIALAFYPVWGRFIDRVADVRLIDASNAALAAKRRALACHRSQMTGLIDDDPTGFVMTDGHQAHFLTHPEIILAP